MSFGEAGNRPLTDEELKRLLSGGFGGGAVPAARSEADPGLIERGVGSFSSSFSRGVQGVIPGIGAGYADLVGDEDLFDSQIQELQRITADTSKSNENPSSWEEVKEKWTLGGPLSAAGEIVDLAVQGVGGSLGYMAPSIAILGLGKLATVAAVGGGAVAAAPAAPWIAAAALGGAALTRFTQYFSEQMETSYNEAGKDGKEVNTDDINLANQVLSSAGQTLLESVVPISLGAGNISLAARVSLNPKVRNAANTAAARMLVKATERVGSSSKFAKAMGTVGTELATEQGQNIFQRAAAGQELDPNDQEAFDSYVETFVQTLLVAGAFGGVSALKKDPNAVVEPELETDIDQEAVNEAAFGLFGLAGSPPSVTPTPPMYGPGLPVTPLQQVASDEAEKLGRAEAEILYQNVRKEERTPEDIRNLLADRNIIIDESDAEADSAFSKFLYDNIKQITLEGKKDGKSIVSAKNLDKVYELVAQMSRSDTPRRLPLSNPQEALTTSRALAKRKKITNRGLTRDKILVKIEERLARLGDGKKAAGFANEQYASVRADAILREMESLNLARNSPGKKVKVDKELVKFSTDEASKDIINAIDEIDIENQSNVDDYVGAFPEFQDVKKAIGLRNEQRFNEIRESFKRRGLIRKLNGKYYYNRSVDEKARAVPKGTPETPAITETRTRRNTAPVKRWFIPDANGKPVPGASFRSKQAANAWVRKQNKDREARQDRSGGVPSYMPGATLADLKEPTSSKGYEVIQESYDGDTLLDTQIKDFIPLVDENAVGKADDMVRQLQEEETLLSRETQPEYLGDQRIESPENKRLVRSIRSAKNKAEHKAAITDIMKSPASPASVLNKYMMGVDVDGPEFQNVPADTSVDPDTSTDKFGTIPVDISGINKSMNTPVVVKEGKLQKNGKGFGKARLDTQNAEIAENTRFSGWRPMVNAFFQKVQLKPGSLSDGEVTFVNEAPGRNVAIWNDPMTDVPMIFVFDYYEGANGPEYHLYNAHAGDQYGQNVENLEASRGIPQQRGNDVTATAVWAAENPGLAEQFSQARMAAHSMGRVISDSDDQVERMKNDRDGVNEPEGPHVPQNKNTGKSGLFVNYLTKVIDGFYEQGTSASWRQRFIDKWDPIVKRQMALLEKTGISLRAEAEADTMFRMVDRMVPMFVGTLRKGGIMFHSMNASERGMGSGVFRSTETPLFNEYEALTIDKQTGSRVKKKFKSNLYTKERKNETGGLETVLEGAARGEESLVPKLFQYAQAVRSHYLSAEARSGPKPRYTGMTDAQIDEGLALAEAYPEIAVAYGNLQKWNEGLLDFAYQTNLLTLEEAQFLKDSDYTPMYLNLDAESNSHLKRKWDEQYKGDPTKKKINPLRDWDVFRDFTGLADMKDEEINIQERNIDPLQATLRNAMGVYMAGAMNVAKYRALRNEMLMGTTRHWSEARTPDKSTPITIKLKGIEHKFEVDDELLVTSLTGAPSNPWMQAILKAPALDMLGRMPSNILRETVTRNPGFIIPNVMRDSLAVWLLNGGDPRLMINVWKRIGHNARNMPSNLRDMRSHASRFRDAEGKLTNEATILHADGVTTGFEHTDVSASPKQGAKDIMDRIDKSSQGDWYSPVKELWRDLGRLSSFSESATREEVYKHVFAKHLDKLLKEGVSKSDAEVLARAEAGHQAVEILNFSRRGSSEGLRVMSALAPFINARIQGIDVLARAGFKIAPVGIDRLDADAMFKGLMRRGSYLAAGSATLALLNFGDDEYERESGYRRDDHFFVPIPGTSRYVTIPSPFELGVLFKTIPEQITRGILMAMNGEASRGARDSMRAATHAFTSNFGVGNFVPVVARPIIEKIGNYNMHTGVPIDPYWEQLKDPIDRVGTNTTAQARLLGNLTGFLDVSPRYIDNVVGTLAGGLATHAWGMTDWMLRAVPGVDLPAKPAPSSRDIPILRRIISNPDTARGYENDFYEFKIYLDKIVQKVRDAPPAKRSSMHEKYRDELIASARMKGIGKRLKTLREQGKRVQEEGDMNPFATRSALSEINERKLDPLRSYMKLRKEYDQGFE